MTMAATAAMSALSSADPRVCCSIEETIESLFGMARVPPKIVWSQFSYEAEAFKIFLEKQLQFI